MSDDDDDDVFRVVKNKAPLTITADTSSWTALFLMLLDQEMDEHSTSKALALIEAIQYRLRRHDHPPSVVGAMQAADPARQA